MSKKPNNVSTFCKFDDEKQLAFGVVYAPNVPDSQGDYMIASEIERMAHNFLKSGKVDAIDTEHNMQINGCLVVESFIVRKGDPDFPEGAWVLGVHVPDADLWGSVKKGEIGGFSMFGQGKREPRLIEIEIPDDGIVKGETYENADHAHEFLLQFSPEGDFLGGITDEVDGHFHVIKKGTVTEVAGDEEHRHRFSFMEGLIAK